MERSWPIAITLTISFTSSEVFSIGVDNQGVLKMSLGTKA